MSNPNYVSSRVFLPNGIERRMLVNHETTRARWQYTPTAGFPTPDRSYYITGYVITIGKKAAPYIFIPDAEHINTLRVIMLFLSKFVERDEAEDYVHVNDLRNQPKINKRLTAPARNACAKIMEDLDTRDWVRDPDYKYIDDYIAHVEFYDAYSDVDVVLPKINYRPVKLPKNAVVSPQATIIVKRGRPKVKPTADIIASIEHKLEADIVIESGPADPIAVYGETTRYLNKNVKMNYTSNDNRGYVRLFGTFVEGRNIDGEFIVAV